MVQVHLAVKRCNLGFNSLFPLSSFFFHLCWHKYSCDAITNQLGNWYCLNFFVWVGLTWVSLSDSWNIWARTNKVGKVDMRMKRGRQGFLQNRFHHCCQLKLFGKYNVGYCTFSWYMRLRTVMRLKLCSILSHGAQYTLLWTATCLNSRCKILLRSQPAYTWLSSAWINLKGGTGIFGICKWLTTVPTLPSLKPGVFRFSYIKIQIYILYIYSLYKWIYLCIQL